METMLAMLVPIALLGLGWYIMYQKVPAFRWANRMLMKLVRWSWRQVPKKGGGGKLMEPRFRYRDSHTNNEEEL